MAICNSSKQIVENTNISGNGANLTIVNNATGSCSIEMGSTSAYLPSFIDIHCPTNTDYALRFIQNPGSASLDGSSYITKNGGGTSITQLSFNINCNKAYCDIYLTVYTNSNIYFQTSNTTRLSINDTNTTISNNLLLSSYSGTSYVIINNTSKQLVESTITASQLNQLSNDTFTSLTNSELLMF